MSPCPSQHWILAAILMHVGFLIFSFKTVGFWLFLYTLESWSYACKHWNSGPIWSSQRKWPWLAFPIYCCNGSFLVHLRSDYHKQLPNWSYPVAAEKKLPLSLVIGLLWYYVWKTLLQDWNWDKPALARLPGDLSTSQMQLVVPFANKRYSTFFLHSM